MRSKRGGTGPAGKKKGVTILDALQLNASGEGGIRTRDPFRSTRFPVVRTRPTMRPLPTASIIAFRLGWDNGSDHGQQLQVSPIT